MWKSLSLQNSTKIALDEKMRRYWLLRTLALTGQEIAGIRITAGKHWTVCCEEGMTVVNTKTEPVTRWAVRVQTFKPSLTARRLSQRQGKVWTSRTCGTRRMTKTESEAVIGLRETKKKRQHATTSRRIHKKGDNGRERVQPNRLNPRQDLKKVTSCNLCGAVGHREDEWPQRGHRKMSTPSDRSSGRGRSSKQSTPRKRLSKSQGKGSGKRSKPKSMVIQKSASLTHECVSWLGTAGLRRGKESCRSRACSCAGSILHETRSQSKTWSKG